MKFSTIPMVFRMPPQMLEEIAFIADNHMISASAVCRQAVSQYIKNAKADMAGELPQKSAVNG